MIKFDECEEQKEEIRKIIRNLPTSNYMFQVLTDVYIILDKIEEHYSDIDIISNNKTITNGKKREDIQKIKQKIKEKTEKIKILKKYGELISKNEIEIAKLSTSRKLTDQDRVDYLKKMNSSLERIKETYITINELEHQKNGDPKFDNGLVTQINQNKLEIRKCKKAIAERSGIRNVFSSLIGQVDKKILNRRYNSETVKGRKRWDKHCKRVKKRYKNIFKFAFPKMLAAGVLMVGGGPLSVVGIALGAYTLCSSVVKYVNKKRYGGPLLVNPKPRLYGTYSEIIKESVYEFTSGKKISKKFDKENSAKKEKDREREPSVPRDESTADIDDEMGRKASADIYTDMKESTAIYGALGKTISTEEVKPIRTESTREIRSSGAESTGDVGKKEEDKLIGPEATREIRSSGTESTGDIGKKEEDKLIGPEATREDKKSNPPQNTRNCFRKALITTQTLIDDYSELISKCKKGDYLEESEIVILQYICSLTIKLQDYYWNSEIEFTSTELRDLREVLLDGNELQKKLVNYLPSYDEHKSGVKK